MYEVLCEMRCDMVSDGSAGLSRRLEAGRDATTLSRDSVLAARPRNFRPPRPTPMPAWVSGNACDCLPITSPSPYDAPELFDFASTARPRRAVSLATCEYNGLANDNGFGEDSGDVKHASWMLLRVTPGDRPFTGGLACNVNITVPGLLVLRAPPELRGTVLDVYDMVSAELNWALPDDATGPALSWNDTKLIWSLLAAATIFRQSSLMYFSSERRRLDVRTLHTGGAADEMTSGGAATSGVVSTTASVDW